jgi:hypothetical protein
LKYAQAIPEEVNTASLVLNNSRPKNLLRYKPRKYGANRMTFVPNDDGSITVSGTATARTVYRLNMDKSIVPGAGTYVLSSGGVSTSSSTYWVEVYVEYDSSSHIYKQTYTNSTYVQFTLSTNTIRNVTAYIIIASGATCNKTFKPMLCTLDDWNKSTTFYPPAISISELYRTAQTVSSVWPSLALFGEYEGGLNTQPVNTTWCGYIASDSSTFPSQYALSRVYPMDETGSSRGQIIELMNGGKLTRYYDGSTMSWSEYALTPYVQQYVRSDVTTSPTSLSDTGVSVTLQEIGTYRITGTVLYVYAEPEEVALYVGDNRIAYTSGTNATDLSLTVSGFVRATSRNSTTVKLYAKTNSSRTNRVTLMAEHVSLDY